MLIELLLTREQLLVLADVVDDAINQAREECVDYEPGSQDWNELVARAKELQGLLAEIESA
jgi:hypothetical protein